MKKILIALLCTLSLQGLAVNRNSFVLTGEFLRASDVNYQVCLVESDGSCVSILEEKNVEDYHINLEIGREYVVDFTYGSVTKSLLIWAEAPEYFQLDVDFRTEKSAVLSYSYLKRRYKLQAYYTVEQYAQKELQEQ